MPEAGRVIAMGDIHGCLTALDLVLKELKLTSDDRFVPLGDFVDRGFESKRVLDRLIELTQKTQLIPILGNHDQMMLEARDDPSHDWLRTYGKLTLYSYGSIADGIANVPPEHWEFLEKTCRPYYETDTEIFVHANAYPDTPMKDQPDSMLRWEFLNEGGPPRHHSGKRLVCGHSAQQSGNPLNFGHTVCIDTFAYSTGWLTAMDATSGMLWQAKESGETRTGWIDDYH